MIFKGLSVLTKPYSVSKCLAESMVKAENFAKSTWKFTYPPTAVTWSIKENFDLSRVSTKRLASARGFSPSCLASSKHSEEASCPNSGLGGFCNDKCGICFFGKSFLRASAKLFSHSRRNSARGFWESINAFLHLLRVI